MKDFTHILMAGITTGMIAFLGFLPSVHAETIINDGFLQVDTVWDKAHSPYILNDVVTVPTDVSLTIEPGTTIRAESASLYDPYIYVNGSIQVDGSASDPVNIGDIFGITIDHGVGRFSHTEIVMRGGITFIGARGTIASSTIGRDQSSQAPDGLYIQDSIVNVVASTIRDHVNGIVVQDSGGIFQAISPHHMAMTDQGSDTDVIGGLIAQAESVPSSVTVTRSSLVSNTRTAIFNASQSTIDAAHNWWGSAEGPSVIRGGEAIDAVPNGIHGLVLYTPWLDRDPKMSQSPVCCSSILFLPGLEASRLYRDEDGIFGIGTSTNRLWEPNRNDDVRKLFLGEIGQSLDTSIYAGGPIGRALGFKSIYGSFMKMMDGLMADGSIHEWRPYGYDWRAAIGDVVMRPTQRATTTEDLIQTVESLAARSQTGKVTIVAHSNGGLVAKYLVKMLADRGEESLIDSVISVAVPYLGTPQAILGLLHGDNQSIFGGLILRRSVAKELGTNMASAYSLLPSASYFMRIVGPTIAYASTTGESIIADSSSEQDSFIAPRANAYLLKAAQTLRAVLDPFSWPMSIARWAIVGWGNETAKGIVYSSRGYSASTTSMGDSTVVAPSASYEAGTVASVDLPGESAMRDKEYDHANILESPSVQSAVKTIVTGQSIDQSVRTTSIIDKLEEIPNISIGEPNYAQEKTFLVVSTHSPVELHLYDSRGRHTGPAPLPMEIDEDIEEGLWDYVERDVVGSSYRTYGEERAPETYISVPDTGGTTYSVAIRGIGIGEFTYQVERIRGGEVLDSVSYQSIPVTPLTYATTSVTTRGTETVSSRLASSSPALSLDIDGDGGLDLVVQAGAQVSLADQLGMLKKSARSILGDTRGKNIIRRLEKLEERAARGTLKHPDRRISHLAKKVAHMKVRGMTSSDRQRLLDLFDTFLATFD